MIGIEESREVLAHTYTILINFDQGVTSSPEMNSGTKSLLRSCASAITQQVKIVLPSV